MPEYIKLCMATWKQPYIVLNYNTLNDYTNLPIDKLQKYTLPVIADCVRVHVLRDNGGYWLDTDTIMLGETLPTDNIVGSPEERTNSIGFLYTEPKSDMFVKGAEYQDNILKNNITKTPSGSKGDLMGNAFTDKYVKENLNIKIYPNYNTGPEVYKIKGNIPRKKKYQKFYFENNYNLKDFDYGDIIMLHNSWTPRGYKDLSCEEVLKYNCTLSNILREINKE